MEELTRLPGVGRKTANVVLSNAFGQPAIAVDTHVFRVSNRTGLGRGKTPEEVERMLRQNIPMEQWSQAHHWLIRHGRQICAARKPRCYQCPLTQWCEYEAKTHGS
jgi:endonuclease-3